VAIEFASRWPDMVGGIVLDGLALIPADVREEYKRMYFRDYPLSRWGTHVHDMWNMRRDSALFWPWYRAQRSAMRSSTSYSLDNLHQNVIRSLKGMQAPAYQAAVRCDAMASLSTVTTPTLLVAAPDDVFFKHLARAAEEVGRNVSIATVPVSMWSIMRRTEAADATLEKLRAFYRSHGNVI
jgi:pimeloyl-ACP methyl ester carboxylesterase